MPRSVVTTIPRLWAPGKIAFAIMPARRPSTTQPMIPMSGADLCRLRVPATCPEGGGCPGAGSESEARQEPATTLVAGDGLDVALGLGRPAVAGVPRGHGSAPRRQ